MDFPRSRDACVLNTDEASLIETAVRAAVMSVLKVFCEVSEKRSHRYEVKLAAAERENAALRSRLESAEQELQTLQQISSNYNISTEVTLSHDFIPEHTRETVEEPTRFHSDTRLMIKQEEPVSEDTLCLKSELTDETFAADQCKHPVIYNTQTHKQTPGAQMWNMQQHLQTFSSPKSSLHQSSEKWIPGDGHTGKSKSRECVRRYRERIRADPEKYLAWKEKERSRYQQKQKTINDLSEPMKKQKRKAWREAKRRDRARKQKLGSVNKQKDEYALNEMPVRGTYNPMHTQDHTWVSFIVPNSLPENLLPSRSFRRRKRIQDLPEPMQKLQREAWREATRRHRARKMEQATSASTDTNRTLNP